MKKNRQFTKKAKSSKRKPGKKREQKTAQPHADERKTGINAHLEGQMQRHLAEAEAIRQEAYNAAQTGTGPQPWDRDWYRNKETTHWSFYSDLLEEFEWGWHQTNDLIEVFSWALASPDAQRAVMGIGEPNSPDPGCTESAAPIPPGPEESPQHHALHGICPRQSCP